MRGMPSMRRTQPQIGLLIAVLALFLSFSETLGKSAQTEAISANVKSSNLWAFFQAKTVRMTTVRTAAEELKLTRSALTDPAAKDAMDKQIEAWQKTAARYDQSRTPARAAKNSPQRAKEAERDRDLAMAKYHHYELASAAFQIGIVLASAAVVTSVIALAWLSGLLGLVGLGMLALGVFAPHAVHLFTQCASEPDCPSGKAERQAARSARLSAAFGKTSSAARRRRAAARHRPRPRKLARSKRPRSRHPSATLWLPTFAAIAAAIRTGESGW